MVWANWDSGSRQHQVSAAIVNLDQPVTIQGQYTPLGRQLTAALMDSSRAQNVTWVLQNADGAAQGLADGQFVVSVTIPADFSAAATSFSSAKGDVVKATVDVESSPVASVADVTLAKVVVREAVDSLNGTLTSTYLNQVYEGFNQMGDQFQTVADAAKQLDSGVVAYVGGVSQASAGASQLSTGATQLSDGLATMYQQTVPLPASIRKLAAGMSTMESQTKDLPAQTKRLALGLSMMASQTKDLPAQTQQLAAGLATMQAQTKALPAQTQQLADGLAMMQAQTKDLPAQTQQLADGLAMMQAQTKDLPAQAQQLADGASQVATGAKTYVDTVNSAIVPLITALQANPQLVTQLNALLANSSALPGQVAAAQAAIDQIHQLAAAGPSALPGALPPSMSCDAVLGSATLPPGVDQATACQWYYQGLAAGIAQADQQLTNADANGTLSAATAQLTQLAATLAALPPNTDVLSLLTQFQTGGEELVSGTAQVATGAQQLADGMPGLVSGIGQAASGSQQLADGMPGLVSGISAAASGAAALASGMPALTSGISQAASGSQQLADGMPALASGISQAASGTVALADGMPALASGISQAASGTRLLAAQMPALVSGIGQSATGALQLSTGVDNLKTGLSTAATQGVTLSQGATQLADGLAKGQSQIPTYTAADRQSLSAAVTTPIDTGNLVGAWALDAGWVALLLVLALWLGALAVYVVVRRRGRALLTSTKPTATLVASTLAPGVAIVAAQALVVSVVGQVALGLPVGTLAAMTGILLLAGVAFALVNYALVAWLKGAGRVVSVALAVLGAATMLTSAVPGVFTTIGAFTPLGPVLNAIQALATDTPGVVADTMGILGWLVVGALASGIAVMRARRTTFQALLTSTV